MGRALPPGERLARRRERLRLISFLAHDGKLQCELLPAGEMAFTRLSRSGGAFSGRAVNRLLARKGFKYRDARFAVFSLNGRVSALPLPL